MAQPEQAQCEAATLGNSPDAIPEKSMEIRRVANGWIVHRNKYHYGENRQDEVYISLESVLEQVEAWFSEEV